MARRLQDDATEHNLSTALQLYFRHPKAMARWLQDNATEHILTTDFRLWFDYHVVLGRDHSPVDEGETVYVINRAGYQLFSPMQEVNYFHAIANGFVARMCDDNDTDVPAHDMVGQRGCFAKAVRSIQRLYRTKRNRRKSWLIAVEVDRVLHCCSDCLVELAAPGDASPSLLLGTMTKAEMTGAAPERPHVHLDSTGPPASTGSATGQPDNAMNSSLAAPAAPTGSIGPVYTMNSNALPRELKCEIHVSRMNNAMWWAMPHELSNSILWRWSRGAQQVPYSWDWDRYMIDFDTMSQQNVNNSRSPPRKVKLVAVLR